MRYRIFNGNTTADEYYAVYPDGIAIRKLVAWPGDESGYGGNPNFWQVLEWIIINDKGVTPEESLEKDVAFTFMNERSDEISFKWPLPTSTYEPLCVRHPEIADWNVYIGRVHVADRPDPFVIFAKDKCIFPYKPCVNCHGDHPRFGLFPADFTWKNWPVTLEENFVLGIDAKDDVGRTATCVSFLDCNPYSCPAERPSRPTTWLFLTGATDLPSCHLVELAKSWLNPADITTGYESGNLLRGMSYGRVLYEGYSYSERAYTFRKFGEDHVEFTMTPKDPVINPIFIINGWRSPRAKVIWNGEHLSTDLFESQISDGDLILWVNKKVTEPIEIKITT